MTKAIAASPLAWFAGVLLIGAVAGWALGNDWRVSFGLYVALVASFAVGRYCGREEWTEEQKNILDRAMRRGHH